MCNTQQNYRNYTMANYLIDDVIHTITLDSAIIIIIKKRTPLQERLDKVLVVDLAVIVSVRRLHKLVNVSVAERLTDDLHRFLQLRALDEATAVCVKDHESCLQVRLDVIIFRRLEAREPGEKVLFLYETTVFRRKVKKIKVRLWLLRQFVAHRKKALHTILRGFLNYLGNDLLGDVNADALQHVLHLCCIHLAVLLIVDHLEGIPQLLLINLHVLGFRAFCRLRFGALWLACR